MIGARAVPVVGERSRVIRWPVQLQLLVPTLSIVVATIALASGATAYWRVVQVRRDREAHLRQVAESLSEATFPLGGRVLRQMSGLAGAELVLVDSTGKVEDATLDLSADDAAVLARWAAEPADARGRHAVRIHSRSYLGERIPLVRRFPSGRSGALMVLYPEDRWSAAMIEAAYPSLLAGALMAAVVVVVTTLLARRFVQPIAQLRHRAAAIAAGDFTPLPPRRRNDEIRDLVDSINRMAEQLGRYESEVRHHERLRTLGQLGAAVAHTLRNLAAGAAMAVEFHRRECSDASGTESLEIASRQLRLIESYVQRFLAMSRSQPAPHEPVDLRALVAEAVDLVGPAARHANVALSVSNPPSAAVARGDRDLLRQALVNLLLNAIEAAGKPAPAGMAAPGEPPAPAGPGVAAGRVEVHVTRLEPDAADRPSAAVTIRDSGAGPSAELAPRLFEPFVTDKPGGSGLGLYVSKQAVESHGGTIAWRRDREMTCFTITLPLI